MTEKLPDRKEDRSATSSTPGSDGVTGKKSRSKKSESPPNITPPATESKSEPPPAPPAGSSAGGAQRRRNLYYLLVVYILEFVVFLALLISAGDPAGCWYQQLPETIKDRVLIVLVAIIGTLVGAIITWKGAPTGNALLKVVFYTWVSIAIPCAILLVYFLTISGVDKAGNYTSPKCSIPVTASTAPTPTYTSVPLPSQTVTLLTSSIQTTTPSLAPTQADTPAPSLTPAYPQTITPPPLPAQTVISSAIPACMNATVSYAELLLGGGWKKVIIEANHHIKVDSSEVSGMTSLLGRVGFTDPAIPGTCPCSWFRGTGGDTSGNIEITLSADDCSFATPPGGAGSALYLFLKVDGRPDIPFVIEFR